LAPKLTGAALASVGQGDGERGEAAQGFDCCPLADQTIISLLESLQRERELREDESSLMERTVRRMTPRREIWRWSEREDRMLKEFIKRRAKVGRPKPFQPNDEVRLLAAGMGRTYMAVHRRIERLRKRMKCSDASQGSGRGSLGLYDPGSDSSNGSRARNFPQDTRCDLQRHPIGAAGRHGALGRI
jgi:hypothetical protein